MLVQVVFSRTPPLLFLYQYYVYYACTMPVLCELCLFITTFEKAIWEETVRVIKVLKPEETSASGEAGIDAMMELSQSMLNGKGMLNK